MIIEFIGCTGSGKTRFSDQVIRRLKEYGVNVIAVQANHFSLCGPVLKRLNSERLQHVVMDIIGLPFLLAASAQERRFLRFAWRMLWSYKDPAWVVLNRFRNICRMVSTHFLLRKRTVGGGIGIVDEGIVHTIHGLFVRHYGSPDFKKLDEFVRLVPFPDLIVHVSAPLDVTTRRTLARLDRPGGRTRLTDEQLIQFIKNAKTLFDMFTSLGVVKTRVIHVDAGNPTHTDYVKAISEIVQRILQGAQQSSYGSKKKNKFCRYFKKN